MANLGSDTTDANAQSLNLPSGYTIDEDGGDLVIRDTGGTVTLRRTDGGAWSLENNDLNSVGTASVTALEAEDLDTVRFASAFDGTDHEKIQAAINDLPAGGGVVFVSSGEWVIDHDNPITLPDRCVLMGTGRFSTTLINDDTGVEPNSPLIRNEDTENGNVGIEIRNLGVDGNRNSITDPDDNNPFSCIDLIYCERSSVANVYATNANRDRDDTNSRGEGIEIRGGSENKVTSTVTEENRYNGLKIRSDSCTVSDFIGINDGAGAIQCAHHRLENGLTNVRGITVSNGISVFTNNNVATSVRTGFRSHGADNVSVNGMHVNWDVSSNEERDGGFVALGEDGRGTTGISFTGCSVEGSHKIGFWFDYDNLRGETEDVRVNNCRVEGSTDACVRLESDDAVHMTVSNSTFYGDDGSVRGVEIPSQVEDTHIIGNTFTSISNPIWLDSEGAIAITISGNTFYECTDKMQFSGKNHISFHISNNRWTRHSGAVLDASPSSTIQNLAIISNTVHMDSSSDVTGELIEVGSTTDNIENATIANNNIRGRANANNAVRVYDKSISGLIIKNNIAQDGSFDFPDESDDDVIVSDNIEH